jgi:hypothetical protein
MRLEKCTKIAKLYFSDVLNNGDKLNPAADAATENFIEIAVQEARIDELLDEKNNRLSLSFFLSRLLHEFRHQDISGALINQLRGTSESAMHTPH